MPMTFDITEPATYIPIVAGVIIPFVVALLARPAASATLKTVLAAVSAGLTALGLYLTDTTHVTTWEGALSAFILALIIAATSRKTLTDQWVDATLNKTPGIVGAPSGP